MCLLHSCYQGHTWTDQWGMCLAGVFQRLGRLAPWKESLLHLAVWARLVLHELEKEIQLQKCHRRWVTGSQRLITSSQVGLAMLVNPTRVPHALCPVDCFILEGSSPKLQSIPLTHLVLSMNPSFILFLAQKEHSDKSPVHPGPLRLPHSCFQDPPPPDGWWVAL